MSSRRRIALYGGTFDPVHVGHMSVARNLVHLFELDEVLFIPAYVAPHKRHAKVSPALHRYAMLALATQLEERFRVSSVELDAPERPYTVETLSRFRALLADAARLFFVMGADSWMEITTWREWERVLSLCDHIVVTRPGYEVGTSHVDASVRKRIVDVRGASQESVASALGENDDGGPRIYLTDVVKLDVSATAIRHAAANVESESQLSSLVAAPVADYIKKYSLYREVHGTGIFDARNEQNH